MTGRAASAAGKVASPWRAWLAWGALLAWMGLIFYLSHQPDLPQLPGGFWDTVFKKSSHAAAYAILMGLWWQALITVRPARPATLAAALALTLVYAASDEWHQTFIPGRHGQLADVLVDLSGGLAALIILRRWRLKRD
ncbi:MAG: VanZ family protein [Anaerolineae bacterium]